MANFGDIARKHGRPAAHVGHNNGWGLFEVHSPPALSVFGCKGGVSTFFFCPLEKVFYGCHFVLSRGAQIYRKVDNIPK
mgnify:CR=1 FL=1